MTQSISILYFASLGERLKTHNEDFKLTEKTITVSQLRAQLAQRGPQWHSQLLHASVRAAVNQAVVGEDALVNPGDEVAFFPPVTGG